VTTVYCYSTITSKLPLFASLLAIPCPNPFRGSLRSSQDAKNLLVDRDTLLASISSSHDVHVSKAYAAESIMEEKEKHNAETIIKKYTDDASTRNRSRIMELYKVSCLLYNERSESQKVTTYC